jgi:type II restriction enzyme
MQHRTLIYNLTVPITRTNVDLCLFSCSSGDLSPEVYRTAQRYIALGELKGGIDPAGADEHWKTARAALDRIRAAFSRENYTPHTFFIGAAIERAMADEIWNQLNSGILENAANLTHDDQIASLSNWLYSL